MQSYNQLTRWADLLHKAVTEPGVISQAYSRFHSYSVGNQILAWFQCAERAITPGPIATFMRWKAPVHSSHESRKAQDNHVL